MLVVLGDYTPGSQGFDEWGGGCSCQHGRQPNSGAILDAGLPASWHAVRGGQVCFLFFSFCLVPYSLAGGKPLVIHQTSWLGSIGVRVCNNVAVFDFKV